jgi:uncharacterized protein (DUF2126 family)
VYTGMEISRGGWLYHFSNRGGRAHASFPVNAY